MISSNTSRSENMTVGNAAGALSSTSMAQMTQPQHQQQHHQGTGTGTETGGGGVVASGFRRVVVKAGKAAAGILSLNSQEREQPPQYTYPPTQVETAPSTTTDLTPSPPFVPPSVQARHNPFNDAGTSQPGDDVLGSSLKALWAYCQDWSDHLCQQHTAQIDAELRAHEIISAHHRGPLKVSLGVLNSAVNATITGWVIREIIEHEWHGIREEYQGLLARIYEGQKQRMTLLCN